MPTDSRTITLNGGQDIHGKNADYIVQLADGASMSSQDAQSIIDSARTTFGDANQWLITPVMAGVIAQSPELFQQYWDAENLPV